MNIKTITLFLFTAIFFTSCKKQVMSQEELSTNLHNEWCSCLQKSNSNFEEILTKDAIKCLSIVMTTYVNDSINYQQIKHLIEQKKYDASLTDYEKERLFGKELGSYIINNAVDNCDVYRQAVINMKKHYIALAQQEVTVNNLKDLDELINVLKEQLDALKNTKVTNVEAKNKISHFYTIYGLLLEYKNRPDQALEQYNMALELNPENSSAYGFKRLLLLKESKSS
jgi:tetratricopeptide (TPR) repeat protein